MANTSQKEEPKANPYNQNKEWHVKDKKEFVSSNSLFFDNDDSEQAEEVSGKEKTTKQKASTDQPYK
jgi:hypothetical protein